MARDGNGAGVKSFAEKPLPALIVILQVMTSLVVAAGFALVDNSQAQAAVLAGMVYVLPGGYFAWRATVERSPGRLLGHGIMKTVVTVSLMAAALAMFRPAPLGFFVTMGLMQAMYVVGPMAFGARSGAARRDAPTDNRV